MNGMDRRTGRALAGTDHLAQSIEDILSTPIGSRVGNRAYGSLVPAQLDQPNNAAGRLRLVAAAALSLLRLEGRARLSRVTLSPGDVPHAVVLTVTGRRTDVAGSPAFTAASTVRAASALA